MQFLNFVSICALSSETYCAAKYRRQLCIVPQVLTSEFVDAQRILLMLPSGQLPELRALLLERIGHHQEALRCLQSIIRCGADQAALPPMMRGSKRTSQSLRAES